MVKLLVTEVTKRHGARGHADDGRLRLRFPVSTWSASSAPPWSRQNVASENERNIPIAKTFRALRPAYSRRRK